MMMMMMMLSHNRIIPMQKTMNDELTIVFFMLLNMSIELLFSLSLSFTHIFSFLSLPLFSSCQKYMPNDDRVFDEYRI